MSSAAAAMACGGVNAAAAYRLTAPGQRAGIPVDQAGRVPERDRPAHGRFSRRTRPPASSSSSGSACEQDGGRDADRGRDLVRRLGQRAGQQGREPGGVAARGDRPRAWSRCPSRPPAGPAPAAGRAGPATTWRATVAWPWPCGTVPSSTDTTPPRVDAEPDQLGGAGLAAALRALLGRGGEPDVADVGRGRVGHRRDADAGQFPAGHRGVAAGAPGRLAGHALLLAALVVAGRSSARSRAAR